MFFYLGSFQTVDLPAMTFPAEFKIDYVRVWQRKGLKDSVTCDPPRQSCYFLRFQCHLAHSLNPERPSNSKVHK